MDENELHSLDSLKKDSGTQRESNRIIERWKEMLQVT